MMSTPPSPSNDKFDVLQNVSSEQRKCLERVMEKLKRDEEMAEKLRIEKEKARMEKEKAEQLYESSLRELEQTTLTVKAVLEPMKKVDDCLKITDPPLPTFSLKGEKKKEVGECAHYGSREGSGTLNFNSNSNSRLHQRKRPRVVSGKDKVEEEKSKAATFTPILKLVAQLSAELTPRKSALKDMIQEELSKLANAYETDKEEDMDEDEEEEEDDAIAKKQKKKGSSTQGEKEVGEYHGVNRCKKRSFRGTYTLRRHCDLKIIDHIKMNLDKEGLEGLKASCFGHLLEIEQLKCQGQLLVHLLLNLDRDATNKEKKLVFTIKNSNIEFGPTEFSQITGLRMGTWSGTITPSSSSSCIHKKIFKGRSRILLKDVKEAFLRHKGKGELSLKLALLYFLCGTLLGRNKNKNKRIDLRYVDLIEDLHKFNEFPWGQVAYEFLVSSSLATRARMDNSSELKKSIYLEICGFSVALQVWAYESIPGLAEHCAVRLNISGNLTPSILHWSTQRKVVCFDALQNFFTPGEEACLEDVRVDTKQQVGKGKLRSHKDTAEHDTIIISDSDDDDDDLVSRRENKRNGRDLGETRNSNADSDARSTTDSDVDSDHMDDLVAKCVKK